MLFPNQARIINIFTVQRTSTIVIRSWSLPYLPTDCHMRASVSPSDATSLTTIDSGHATPPTSFSFTADLFDMPDVQNTPENWSPRNRCRPSNHAFASLAETFLVPRAPMIAANSRLATMKISAIPSFRTVPRTFDNKLHTKNRPIVAMLPYQPAVIEILRIDSEL